MPPQEVLSQLHCWCETNLMKLNVSKCKIMTFTNKKNQIISDYTLNDINLERVSNITDLGVTFQQNLKFNLHYEKIKNKSLQMLGFLYRHTQDFTQIHTLKNLYYAYVRSRLEYCSTVWSPQYDVHIRSLEAVQHKFLRILAYKLRMRVENHDYTNIMSITNIMNLKNRRDLQDIIFLHKLLNDKIYSPELLSKVNFRVDLKNTRSKFLFTLNRPRTDIGKFSPNQRMMKLGNIASSAGVNVSGPCLLKDFETLF